VRYENTDTIACGVTVAERKKRQARKTHDAVCITHHLDRGEYYELAISLTLGQKKGKQKKGKCESTPPF